MERPFEAVKPDKVGMPLVKLLFEALKPWNSGVVFSSKVQPLFGPIKDEPYLRKCHLEPEEKDEPYLRKTWNVISKIAILRL